MSIFFALLSKVALDHPDLSDAQSSTLGVVLVVLVAWPLAAAAAMSIYVICDDVMDAEEEDSVVPSRFGRAFSVSRFGSAFKRRVAPCSARGGALSQSRISETCAADKSSTVEPPTDVEVLRLDEVRIRKSSKTLGVRMEDGGAAQAAARAHTTWSAEEGA